MSIEGQGLKALQRKLKTLPNRAELTRELNKALREAAKPLEASAHDAARVLPSTGGLAERIASKPVTANVGQGRLRMRVKGSDARTTNSGRLKHPVYARADQTRDQWTWVAQAIPPGWFTKRMLRDAPAVRIYLVAAMERIAQKVAGA
jgi:hypothetical protein